MIMIVLTKWLPSPSTDYSLRSSARCPLHHLDDHHRKIVWSCLCTNLYVHHHHRQNYSSDITTIFLSFYSLFFSFEVLATLDPHQDLWQLQTSLLFIRIHLLHKSPQIDQGPPPQDNFWNSGMFIHCSFPLPIANTVICKQSNPPLPLTQLPTPELPWYMQETMLRYTLYNICGRNQLTLSAFCHCR